MTFEKAWSALYIKANEQMVRYLEEPRNILAEPLGSAEPRLKNTALIVHYFFQIQKPNETLFVWSKFFSINFCPLELSVGCASVRREGLRSKFLSFNK